MAVYAFLSSVRAASFPSDSTRLTLAPPGSSPCCWSLQRYQTLVISII